MKKIDKNTLPNIIYIVVFLAVSLVPLFLFSSRQAAIGNETKAEKPKLSDGVELTANIDAYFSQNFGFRNRLVYARNALEQAFFKTSGQSDVIVGEDGWLFYGRALDDFLGTSVLSDTELDRMAVVVEMMQNYAKREGKDFIFVSAPNKMSVYGEYMPYYYIEEKGLGNYELLHERLTTLGVNTVQLKNALTVKKLEGQQLYHKLDSHWNNYGAAAAYEAMADKLFELYGADYSAYTHYGEVPYSVKNNFSGDLQSMLLPGSSKKDAQVEFDIDDGFEYVNRFRSVEDLVITTQNQSAAVDKSVTLFRDSFGNALYWFFAKDYASLTAKREIPYNIYQAAKESDLVAVELVERNLKNLLVYTPIVPSWNLGADYFSDVKIYDLTEFDGLSADSSIIIKDTSSDSSIKVEQSAKTTDSVENLTNMEEYLNRVSDIVMNVTTTADGLTQISGSSDILENFAYMYMKIDSTGQTSQEQNADNIDSNEQTSQAQNAVIYQLIPGQNGDFTLYLTDEDADIFKADTAGIEYTIIVKSGNKYIEIPINVTLQD